MKVIVTGGAGFIGSAVCRELLDRGAAVVNLDKMTYAADEVGAAELDRRDDYELERVDVCDQEAVAALFRRCEPQAVVHLAAETHVDRSITGSSAFVQSNVVGTHVILEAALGHWRSLTGEAQSRFRMLHVSTDEVYGALGSEGVFTEESAYRPRSPYAASKAASDHLASAWFHTYGLPVLITNCSNNYGPRQFPEKLIPLMILNALEGRELPVYGDGAQVRDWLHVEDHARALVDALEKGRPGDSLNIGARCERTNLQVVEGICSALDRLIPGRAPHQDLIRFVQDRPGHDRRYAIDPSKAEMHLGWRPRIPFEDGLAATVDWYLANRAWWTGLRARYDRQRLGLVE